MNALSPAYQTDPSPPRLERAPRATTLLITAKLIADGAEGLCRVRNMSATGMMIEMYMDLVQGAEVRVDLRCGWDLQARVVWTRTGVAGLAFLAPIDVKAVLARQVPQSGLLRAPLPRSPRLAAPCAITVGAGKESHQACLLDISQSGARLRLPFRVAREERLVLSIPGLPAKGGVVRWTREAEAGLAFYQAIPFGLLAEWIEERDS
jgi:hypothetical protein